MMKYQISPKARGDLVGIMNYTVANWGEEQGSKYLRTIYQTFDKIACGDIVYKQVFEDNKNINIVRCEHHYIFFVLKTKPIIFAVLHKKMDFINTLKTRL